MGSQNLAGIQNYNLESLTVFSRDYWRISVGQISEVTQPPILHHIIPINQSISGKRNSFRPPK
jgi:hypothetical protein